MPPTSTHRYSSSEDSGQIKSNQPPTHPPSSHPPNPTSPRRRHHPRIPLPVSLPGISSLASFAAAVAEGGAGSPAAVVSVLITAAICHLDANSLGGSRNSLGGGYEGRKATAISLKGPAKPAVEAAAVEVLADGHPAAAEADVLVVSVFGFELRHVVGGGGWLGGGGHGVGFLRERCVSIIPAPVRLGREMTIVLMWCWLRGIQ